MVVVHRSHLDVVVSVNSRYTRTKQLRYPIFSQLNPHTQGEIQQLAALKTIPHLGLFSRPRLHEKRSKFAHKKLSIYPNYHSQNFHRNSLICPVNHRWKRQTKSTKEPSKNIGKKSRSARRRKSYAAHA